MGHGRVPTWAEGGAGCREGVRISGRFDSIRGPWWSPCPQVHSAWEPQPHPYQLAALQAWGPHTTGAGQRRDRDGILLPWWPQFQPRKTVPGHGGSDWVLHPDTGHLRCQGARKMRGCGYVLTWPRRLPPQPGAQEVL